jgi:hypothetical protein
MAADLVGLDQGGVGRGARLENTASTAPTAAAARVATAPPIHASPLKGSRGVTDWVITIL